MIMASQPADDIIPEISQLSLTPDHDVAVLQPTPTANSSPRSSKTVLPQGIASAVSLFAKSSSLSLRIGGFFTSAALSGARITTLTGFEVGRAVLEGILGRAGQDVVETSTGAIGRAAAENIMEGALTTLHRIITHTSFFISAGFQVGSTSVNTGLAVGQYLLSALDAVLGDTETSKAIATIIVLIQREIKSPDTAHGSDTIGLADVLTSIVTFALLQRWGKKKTSLEHQEAGDTEVIWDIVVLAGSKGTSMQIAPHESAFDTTSTYADTAELEQQRPNSSASFMSALGGTQDFEGQAADDNRSFMSASHSPLENHPDGQLDQAFRDHLTQQLKPGASVKVTMQSMTINSITVEVTGDESTLVEPPQGYSLVAADESEKDKRKLTFQNRTKRRKSGNFEIQKAIPSRRSSLKPRPLSYASTDDNKVGDAPMPPSPPPKNELVASADTAASTTGSTPANSKRQRTALAPLGESRLPVPKTSSTSPRSSPTLKASESADTTKSEKLSNFKQNMKQKKSYKNLVEFWSQSPSKRRPTESTRTDQRNTHLVRPAHLSSQPPPPSMSTIVNRSIPLRAAASSQSRPVSPAFARRPPSAGANYGLPTTENLAALNARSRPTSRMSHHHKRGSSVYSFTAASETSLVLHNTQASTAPDVTVSSLSRTGQMPMQFPPGPFAKVALRYLRFSLAAYGPAFLRFLGAAGNEQLQPEAGSTDHAEHQSFASYARLPNSTVLLSSFLDPQGVPVNKEGVDIGTMLVHFVSLDHEAKAVVLTCRGTLGFEDILTDLTADYEDFEWEGEVYQVHQGILHAASKLLLSNGGRVTTSLRSAMEEHPKYGLVMCGHSLGGGVAAVLAMMLAQPNRGNVFGESAFITKLQPVGHAMLTDGQHAGPVPVPQFNLPPGRPIHVYAYGPAASVTPALQRATRGLITSIIHGQDSVPYLSLGALRDFQRLSHAFKKDSNDAKGEVRRRVWESLLKVFQDHTGFGSQWPSAAAPDSGDDDEWAWLALQSLRSSLDAVKLVPPGEVIRVEGRPVLQRHAFVSGSSQRPKETRSFKPATHVTVTHIKDVEKMFGEMTFGASMWLDHIPIRYESVLEALEKGLG